MTKEEKAVKELQRMYFKNLDNIYEVSASSARAFGLDYIPLKTLKAIIQVVKKGIEKGMKNESKR